MLVPLLSFLHNCAVANDMDFSNKCSGIVLSVSSEGTTCGRPNGNIVVTAIGGTPPYTYTINGNSPQSTGYFLFLTAGSYSIQVTDAAGQTANDNVTITNTFSPPTDVLTQMVSPSGCTSKDASLTLTGVGGTPPYTYSIDQSNFQSSNVFANLTAGSYYCAVKDVNGCTSPFVWYNTTNIAEVCPIKQSGQNRSYECFPFRTHLGLYNITGGVPPYEYSLDGGNFQTDYIFYPVTEGLHTITVQDASGSILLYSVAVHDWCSSAIAFTSEIDANCNQNGSITVHPINGTGPYSYAIDDGNFQTSNVFAGLRPGDYAIIVRDADNQLGSEVITVPNNCFNLVTSITNTRCGFAEGSIEVQPSGGIAPYQYSLDNVQYTTDNKFTLLTAKDYTVYVKDASGTIATKAVAVTDAPGPVLSSVEVTGTDCDKNTGTARIISQGGTAPFQYVLNAVTFQADPSFSSLAADSYKFSVYDANGCFDSRTATIPVNNNLFVNAGNDVTICEGTSVTLTASSNGSIFSWSPASAINNTSTLSPVVSTKTTTTYIVTATLGVCANKDTVTVFVNPAPLPHAGSDTSICPEQNLLLSGSGGTTFSWSPSTYLSDASSANPVMSGALKGNYVYSLDVKDNNGCSSLRPALVKVSVVSPVVDAGTDTVVLTNHPVQLNAIDPGHNGFVQYNWSPGTGLNNANIANPIAIIDKDMTYKVVAQTQNGCTATDEINLKVYKGVEIYVPSAFTPNHDGHNDILKAIPAGIKEFKFFNIYDRWGRLVFQTKDASMGWDGRLNGALQNGTFIWMAEGIDYNGNIVRRKGTTTMIQ